MDVYFCDPHSPWQRGTNENTNGLLRQYFPQGTDLAQFSEAYLDAVAEEERNDRARKRLGWERPSERMMELFSLCCSGHQNPPSRGSKNLKISTHIFAHRNQLAVLLLRTIII